MIRICITILMVMVLGGCGTYIYRPTTVKPTFFKQKGDMEVSINAFVFGEGHAAVAITDNIAISATTASTGFAKKDTFNTVDSMGLASQDISRRKTRDNELALGFYFPVSDGSTFEVYGGIGFSSRINERKFTDFRNSSKSFSNRFEDNRYQRYFIQPAFGRLGKYMDFGIANRFSFVKYMPNDATDFISETMFTFKFGYKYVKIMSQMGFTLSSINNKYDYFPFSFGFGLYFQINQAIKE